MNLENINIAVLADRITSARKAAGITQEKAADYLEISRPTYIAIEKATRRPRPAELMKLAKLFGQPLGKIVRSEPVPQPSRPHLRVLLGGNVDRDNGLEDAINRLTAFIDDYQHLEKIVGSRPSFNFPPEVRIPAGSIEKFAEHCAQEERARLNLGAHQPIELLRKVLEDAGLHVFCDVLDSRLSGLYEFVPDFGYCILVNRLHPRDRRRWTIAHEYGHFLSARESPGVDYARPMERKPIGEKFADAFAAAFLMPESGVQRKFYEEVNRTGDFKVADLIHLASYYSVSTAAMALRLEGLGLIRGGTWDDIQQSGVPIGALKREVGATSLDDKDSVESYPERFKLLAIRGFDEGKLSEGQLAQFLRCDRVEAREMVERYVPTRTVDSSHALSLSDSLLVGAVG
jgi:Zn-dependent peptidase ImmA (M78 family)/transcriptional regulator with XRE-family HTH domain